MMMSQDVYNTTNEDAVSNLSMLSTSTMRSSLYFHEKPDRFVQQARPLADVLESHQDVMDREASGTSTNSQAMIKALKALQDKIRSLELERTAAAEKFRHLGQQAEQHKQQQTQSVKQKLNKSSQYSVASEVSTEDTELKKKLQSFNDQFQGQRQELEQLRSKIRQAESDRQLAVNKAKLLEEELTNQQRRKGHEDKLRQLEEERFRGQQQRELERQREDVKREQAQLVEQHKLLKHQMEITKQQHERELLKKSQEHHHQHKVSVDPAISTSSKISEGPTLSSRHGRGVSNHSNGVNARDDLIIKLKSLEQEHQRLLSSQSQTEKRLKMMENKLLEEKHQRKLLQDCNEQYNTNKRSSHDVEHTKTHSIPSKPRLSIPAKKRHRQKKVTHRPHSTTCSTIHYRANYQDVPFVVGTSTGQSHSVTANYQRILSLMKTHSPALCGRVPLVCRSSFTGGISQQDLSCMLRELEEEYTILLCEQQELARVLQERSGVDSAEELSQLQDELYKIEARLTSKGEHIKIIKAQSKRHKHKRPSTHCRSSSVTIPADGEVEIITTVKPKQSSCPTTPKKNRKLLYNMKSLQNTLQRDDLSWN